MPSVILLISSQNKVKVMEDELKELRGWAKEQKEGQIEQVITALAVDCLNLGVA